MKLAVITLAALLAIAAVGCGEESSISEEESMAGQLEQAKIKPGESKAKDGPAKVGEPQQKAPGSN